MHASHERRSSISEILRGLDSAVADLDRAIDALHDVASPGRAREFLARQRRADQARAGA
jgi:hypothetical protein